MQRLRDGVLQWKLLRMMEHTHPNVSRWEFSYMTASPLGGSINMFILPYFVCFLVGTIGNVSVLTYIYYVSRSLKWSVMALGNTLVYITVLSFVDLTVILSIPFFVSQITLRYWLFGNVLCKLYWVLDIASKMCSTFILGALAFDRYMAICHPEMKRVHSVRQTMGICFFFVILSLILVMPILNSATVKNLNFFKSPTYVVKDDVIFLMDSVVCIDNVPKGHRPILLGTLSIIAFLLPSCAIVFFYIKITMKLRAQMSRHIQSRIPYKRITVYTILVTSFFLICQIPFWFSQILTFLAPFVTITFPFLSFLPSEFMMVPHMLPYVSAAFNWMLYAMLNSQFKKGFILVNEKMMRKQTRAMLSATRDVWDGGVALDVASRCDDVVALCPNCEHPLTLRMRKEYSNNTN